MVLEKKTKLAVEEFVNSYVEKYTLSKLRLLMRESKFMRWSDLYEEFRDEDQVSDYYYFFYTFFNFSFADGDNRGSYFDLLLFNYRRSGGTATAFSDVSRR
jgi:hypothetical protein